MNLKSNLLINLEIDENVLCNTFNNNEQIMVKFIKKFPSDNSFDKLAAAIEESNAVVIYETLHTLKGLSSNLGLKKLSLLSNDLLQDVKSKNYSDFYLKFNKIKEERKKIIDCINYYSNE